MDSGYVASDQFDGLVERALPTAEDEDVSAFGDEPLGDRQTNTRRSAANDGDLACKSGHSNLLPLPKSATFDVFAVNGDPCASNLAAVEREGGRTSKRRQFIPELLSRHPGLRVDLVLSDFVRDMVEDRIDLAIRVGAVNDPDSVVKRIASTPLVCVGSRRYFEQHGIPTDPAELANHNCLLYGGLMESANWPFHGPRGRFSVPVRGNLSSNSVETIRSAVLAGVGIGLFAKLSLADELKHPDIVTVLDEFIRDARDVSIVWPRRRFVPARVRRVTDFFATALPPRL